MKYQVKGNSNTRGKAVFSVRKSTTLFGIAADEKQLPNPAELLLGAFAACCLKSIERFSKILKFEYENAQIEVLGERQDSPPKMKSIHYTIQINSQDAQINLALLHKNIQKYGTIYNTLKENCEISGKIELIKD